MVLDNPGNRHTFRMEGINIGRETSLKLNFIIYSISYSDESLDDLWLNLKEY